MAKTRYNRPDYVCSQCWQGNHKNCSGTMRIKHGTTQSCLCYKCKLAKVAEEKLKALTMID